MILPLQGRMIVRGRKPKPIDGLNEHDFTKLACTDGNPRERRRFLAFAHLQDGRRPSEAARMVKVLPQTISTWIKNFRKNSLDGLRDKPGRGAKPYIAPEEYETLRQLVEELQQNRTGGRIRGQDINEIVEKRFGKRPSMSAMYKTLKKAGLVWITSRSKHPKADEEAQLTFKKSLKRKS